MDKYTFRSVIQQLENDGDIRHIDSYSIGSFDLPEISSDECIKGGKAVIIDAFTPKLLNLFASEKRIEAVMGADIETISKKAAAFIKDHGYSPLTFTQADNYKHIKALDRLPMVKHYKGDVSGSLNMACVISKNDNIHNCGLYRIQPLEGSTAVMHCYPGSGLAAQLKKGDDIPVTIAIGTTPHLIFAAACTVPAEIDELKLASRLHPEIMQYIETERYPVPYGTQYIIQGTVSASETHPEGPFMIYTGEYSEKAEFPLLNIELIKAVHNPVYHTTVMGLPPMESSYLGRACARMHFYRMQDECPEITEISHPLGGVFWKEADVRFSSVKSKVEKMLKDDFFYGRFEKINLLQD